MQKKFTIAVIALCLCMCCLVGVTVAWLTSETVMVENTFTYGNVTITLDEADVDEAGVPIEGADRVSANKYHLIPGHTYTKDPTIHVGAESEKCWIFVQVNNGIADLEGDNTIAKQMKNLGWTCIDAENNIYAYKEIVGKNMNILVFQSFDIANTNINGENVENLKITVKGYAVQAESFGSAEAAWNATFGA